MNQKFCSTCGPNGRVLARTGLSPHCETFSSPSGLFPLPELSAMRLLIAAVTLSVRFAGVQTTILAASPTLRRSGTSARVK